jgi:hypothetical protein
MHHPSIENWVKSPFGEAKNWKMPLSPDSNPNEIDHGY